jgi:hypothetical protein
MAFPGPHRNRYNNDAIELHKAGGDDGTPVSCAAATGTGYEMDVNIPYNSWTIGVMCWASGNSAAVNFKVIPYVDHQQTIEGGALAISPFGTSTAATVLTVAASATGSNGFAGQCLAGTGTLASLLPTITTSHGVKVVVTTTNTTGTFDIELVCVPKS